jgi:hypothetical protein
MLIFALLLLQYWRFSVEIGSLLAQIRLARNGTLLSFWRDVKIQRPEKYTY